MLLSNGLSVNAAQTAEVIQANESENLIGGGAHFTLVDAVNLWIHDARDFDHGREWHSEKTAANTEKQSLDTRKSQRRAKLNGGAAAFLGGDMKRFP